MRLSGFGVEQVFERSARPHGDHFVFGVYQTAEHRHGPVVPQELLVLRAPRRQIPQRAARVADHGEAGGFEVLEQDT